MKALTCLLSIRNTESSIEETLESLLSQTFSEFDLFVFDDGSEDRTPSILKKYQKKHSKIHCLFEDKPFGIPYGLNQLLKKVKTPFLALQGAEGISHPTRFEKQLEQMKTSSLVALGSHYIYESKDLKESKTIRVPLYAKKVFYKQADLKTQNLAFHPFAALYSKKILQKQLSFDESLAFFYEWFFLADVQKNFPLRISNLDEILYTERRKEFVHPTQQNPYKEQLENYYLAQLLPVFTRYVVEPQVSSGVIPF